MSAAWPLEPLGNVLTERKEVPSQDDIEMGRIRIIAKIGFHDGNIQLRTGSETKTGMILVRQGDLVVSGINAAKGAIAISESSALIAGTIHYGSYIPDTEKVSTKYLWWLLRSNFFRELLYEHVPGGIKTELKAKRFLQVPVPIPPLAEQRRRLRWIEELAAKIEEASNLRQQTTEEAEAFIISLHKNLSGSRTKKLGDILCLDEDSVPIIPTSSYPQVGVRGFGGGLFAKHATSGMDTTYRAFNRLYEGALVMSQVKAWEGAVAVCGKSLAGYFVSPEYRTFRFVPSEALPSYFEAIVKTEWFWSRLKDATRGVGARRERTRPEQFLNIEIPVPELVQQKESAKIFEKISILNRLQSETAAELDAMLPSILDKAFQGAL